MSILNEVIEIFRSIISFISKSPISFSDITNNVEKVCAFFGLGGFATSLIVFFVIRRVRSLIFKWAITIIICVVGFVLATRYVLPHIL